MSDGGKGSAPRPFSVSNAEYAARWDAIFGRDQVTEKHCPPCHGDCSQGRSCPAETAHETAHQAAHDRHKTAQNGTRTMMQTAQIGTKPMVCADVPAHVPILGAGGQAGESKHGTEG